MLTTHPFITGLSMHETSLSQNNYTNTPPHTIVYNPLIHMKGPHRYSVKNRNRMRAALLLITVTVLVLQVALSHSSSHEDSEQVKVEERQYNCPYYYNMMNSGPPAVSSQAPWLLVGLSIAVLLVSSGGYLTSGFPMRASDSA